MSGFTLMEILVVLVISSATSVVLFQALDRVNRLRGGVDGGLPAMQQNSMAAEWYRLTVRGLISSGSEGGRKFRGDAHEWEGMTINPLGEGAGIATPIRWKLLFEPADGLIHLIYLQDNRPASILTWQGCKPAFVYFDPAGGRHDAWPPPLGQHAPLPQIVFLATAGCDGAPNVVAAPPGHRAEGIDPRVLFGGVK